LTARPDIVSTSRWQDNVGLDPAGYLVNPGDVIAPGKYTAGQLFHARPHIVNGNKFFVWPATEGFTRSGQATIGLHKIVGDTDIYGITVHYEEGRIELSGTFPGVTAPSLMAGLIEILKTPPPDPGLSLYIPGVFETIQFVLADSWNFPHDRDDRTHSIDYSVVFVLIGSGPRIRDPAGVPAPPNPSTGTNYGTSSRVFVVGDGARTLRAIAQQVYGDSDKWTTLVSLNQGALADVQRGIALNKANDLPSYQLPTYRFAIGTRFRY
jgi:hypothetical protein